MTDREALKMMLGRAGVKFAEECRTQKRDWGALMVVGYEIQVAGSDGALRAVFLFNQWGDLHEFRVEPEAPP